MPAFKHHVLVCTQEKPDGMPACSSTGGKDLLERFRASVAAAGKLDDTLVTGCGCLGLCERGPNVLIHPQGRWYTQVQPDQVERIVQSELVQGVAADVRIAPEDGTISEEVLAHRAKVRNAMMARARAGVLPDELTALTGGFRASRALLTAIELDLFSAVGRGASAATIAAAIQADLRGTSALLFALVALGLLTIDDGVFFNTETTAAYLVNGAPHDSREAILHSAALWKTWSHLTESVRAGTPAPVTSPRTGATLEAFIAAMHKNATLRAPALAAAVGLKDVERSLDVGGGSGAYSMAMVRAQPSLRATVFDLPDVLPITRRNIEQAGLSDRIEVVAGNFNTDDLGSGYDLVLLSAICHMLGPDDNVRLLSKAAAALRPGGRVVIQDFLLNDDGTGHATATLFALNMLVNTAHGGSYSTAQYTTWLQQAGFGEVKPIRLPGPTGLLIAAKA